MTRQTGPDYDALVVGGGFYGCTVALHLKSLGLARVAVVEREAGLLLRASFANQARVHQGYHYPRDFTTAYRSRMNFVPFLERFPEAVDRSFTALYAIARRGSHVNARQFRSLADEIGAPCRPASRRHAALFSPSLVEEVFEVEEHAFDSVRLAACLATELEQAGVDTVLGTSAAVVSAGPDRNVVSLEGPSGTREVSVRCVFNCTYGMVGNVGGVEVPPGLARYEVAEVCLVEPPEEVRGLGITVMDGPFFSCMPFPSRGLHSLTHVTYTPHDWWTSATAPGRDPYRFLGATERGTAFDDMRRDAARFVPALFGCRHVDSLYEVKVVLSAREGTDGRPILIHGDPVPGGRVSVLGGKLDNVFDVLSDITARERLSQ